MENNKKNIDELFSDKFIKEVFLAKSNDEIKDIFKNRGLNIVDEQLEILKKAVKEELLKLETMSELELNSVSGGSRGIKGSEELRKVGEFVKTISTGSGAGMTSGFILGFLGSTIKDLWKSNSGVLKHAFKSGCQCAKIGFVTGGVACVVNDHIKNSEN